MNNGDAGTTVTKHHGQAGLLLALAGLVQLGVFVLMSLFVLFFSPLLMCGATIFSVPFAVGAIIFGWKGRKEEPGKAWIAILIGLILVPLSLFLAFYFGDLIYKATA